MQRQPEAHRQVLLPSDVGEALHKLRGTNRREAQCFRPLGECAGPGSGTDVLGEVVAWVG